MQSQEDLVGQIERMPLADLRRACRDAGISPAGSRAHLIDRLVDHSQGRSEPVQRQSPQRGPQGSSRSGGGASSMGGIIGSESYDYVDKSQSYSPSGGAPTRSRGNSATSSRASGGDGYGQAAQYSPSHQQQAPIGSPQYAAQVAFGQQQQQQYQPQYQPQGLSPFATEDDARLAAYTERMSPGHGYGHQQPQQYQQQYQPQQQQQQQPPQQQQYEQQYQQAPMAQQYPPTASPGGGNGYVPSPSTSRRNQFSGPPPSRVPHPDGTNAGNYISDRPSSKVLAPPGGASSFTFG